MRLFFILVLAIFISNGKLIANDGYRYSNLGVLSQVNSQFPTSSNLNLFTVDSLQFVSLQAEKRFGLINNSSLYFYNKKSYDSYKIGVNYYGIKEYQITNLEFLYGRKLFEKWASSISLTSEVLAKEEVVNELVVGADLRSVYLFNSFLSFHHQVWFSSHSTKNMRNVFVFSYKDNNVVFNCGLELSDLLLDYIFMVELPVFTKTGVRLAYSTRGNLLEAGVVFQNKQVSYSLQYGYQWAVKERLNVGVLYAF